MQAYLDALRRDRPIYAFIVGYGALTFALSRALGLPATFQPLSLMHVYVRFAGYGLLLVGIGLAIRSLPKASPVAALSAELRALATPERVAGAAMILGIAVFMSIFTSAKALLPLIVPFWADPLLADLDALLAGGTAPWTYLPRSPAITRIVDGLYGGAWFAVMFTSICAAVLSRGAYRRQYLWTFVIAWTLLGNVLACALMSGGPVYFEALTGQTGFTPLADEIAANAPWSLMIREKLWTSYIDSSAGFAMGISAFPSMHLSITTLFVLQANRIHPRLAWAAAALCIWVLASSVYLGWHYAVDGYFSIAVTVVIWKAVGRAVRARTKPDDCEPVPAFPATLRPASS